jgi:GNAT superfamily N-acetyltransferase
MRRIDTLAEDPEAFGGTLERESAWTEDVWLARVGELAPFVVEDKGRPVAAARLVTGADGWVAPEARRRGLGAELLDAAVEACLVAGHASVRLHVTEGNEPARGLYRLRGFGCNGR